VNIEIPDGFTREDLLACIDRELRLRHHVYPARVKNGKMTLAESLTEVLKMRAVRAVIAQLPTTQPTLGLDARSSSSSREP
jgi:hypothetical protein